MTFKKIIRLTLGAAAIAAPIQQANAAAGYTTSKLSVAHRKEPLALHIWYPTKSDGEVTYLGKNAVFKGTLVSPNAAPTKGKHPLVLLSHGSGGNAVNLAWIAAELADRGIVVVAANHPRTTSQDSIPKETIKIWERPADLTAIADFAQKNGFGAVEIDLEKMAAVGFSLGGHSVLSIAGVRASKQKFVDYCDRYAALYDCKWLAAGGVDFTKIEQARYEQSNLDSRFKTVVAVDPALAQALDLGSIKSVPIPVRIINLGAADKIPAVVNADQITPHFKNAQLSYVKQATHFSFLGECTSLGRIIIYMAGEDPICSETGDRPRSDIHRELKKTIGEYLSEQLK